MRVLPINNYSYRYNVSNENRNITSPVINIRFGNSEPDPFERFKYGIEALDDNSVLFVLHNEDSVEKDCKASISNIPIPIHKIYTMKVTKENSQGKWMLNHSLNPNFAIYRKDNKYYIFNMGTSRFDMLGLTPSPTEEYIIINSQKYAELKSGAKIDGPSKDIFNKLVFELPQRYNTENAEKYLEVKRYFETDAAKQNKIVLNFKAPEVEQNTQPKKKAKKIITFKDIGGLDDIVEKLKKYVIRPVNYPDVFEDIRLNKGILLYGPPRCGKTLIGKALANESGLAYCYMNANEFKTSLVGATEEKIRKYFNEMLEEPSLLFIDEFDAIGKKREGSSNARYDDAALNQLLGCMSDLEKNNTLSFVIAATNRKDLLDEALIATGRFGLHLEVPMPNLEGLKSIYDIHSQNKPISDEVSKDEIAKLMLEKKFNGSDVAEMITNAYFGALERLGMFSKMDAKTFRPEDKKRIQIIKNDLLTAIENLAKQKL